MIVKKKISTWLNKFKPGVSYHLKISLDGKSLKNNKKLVTSYPTYCSQSKTWDIITKECDESFLSVIYEYSRDDKFIYKVQEVIEFDNSDIKEEN